MSETLRIVVAGGGTGGHVYPGVAIVEALRERAATEALFVGARGGVEQRILERGGFAHALLPGYGLRRASLARKAAAPLVVAAAMARAAAVLRAFRPDVVLGTGGFASAAVVMASVLLRVPRVLQEQNSVPGLVNRRLARFADLVLLGYEASQARLPAGTAARVVGNPVRRMPAVSRDAAASRLGIDARATTVLVIGGSRGAHSLNLAGADAAAVLASTRGTQFVILCGTVDRAEVERRVAGAAARVRVLEYLDEVHLAYAAADLAVARSGASCVFELASFGVPAIFVPYPYAADDHQRGNALPLVEAGGAEMVRDADLDGAGLARRVGDLLDRPQRLAAMAQSMRRWAKPGAAADAADAIVELVKKKEPARLAA
jgi:UDP-N-acetylglucosamine--N-acetylmuramyl-(pentapeptide) pyrophosphoryl-undecaprenol N-acetylglucosamine transferase